MNAASAKVSQPRDYKLIVEKDVKIPLRDGTILYGDIFRPDGGSENFPVIMNIGPYQKDKVWVPPPDARRKSQSLHELGDRQPDVVVPARLRTAARRYARLGQIARAVGAEFVPGSGGLLRLHRVGRRNCRGARATSARSAFRTMPLPVASRGAAAAVAEGDHSVGRPRRPVPRPGVSRRHFRDGLHRELA